MWGRFIFSIICIACQQCCNYKERELQWTLITPDHLHNTVVEGKPNSD